MKFKTILFAAIAPLALVGCVGTNPKKAFDDVQKNVAERTGQSVEWRRGNSLSNEMFAAIEPLLKADLTAQTAVTIALLNNRSLQAQFEEIGISQADLAQASRLHNIELTGSWRFPNEPPSALDAEYSAAADLLDLLTLPARKKIAAKNLEQTKLLVADKVLQLAADTQTAFYTLQAQTELTAGLAVIAEANDAAADVAQRQYDAGDINELELHTRQAPSAQSHLDLMKAKAAVQAQRERLNRLLGLAGGQINWQIADELPPLPAGDPSLQNLETLAVAQRLDLAARRRQLESLAAALKLQKNTRFFPGAAVGVDTEAMQNGQRVTGPILELELPVFDQGQPAVARTAAIFYQARDEYEAQEVNARSEVREAHAGLSAARAAVAFSQTNLLPLRKRILRETLLHYNAMQKSSYELLLAREREQQAEQTIIEAARDYWLARVNLERAVGGRLIAGTNAPASKISSESTPSEHQH
jgi:outer membrane protein, heavy metal efflux system